MLKNKVSRVMLLLSLIVIILGGMPVIAGADNPPITILFTHDLHSNLLPFTQLSNDKQVLEMGGYSRLAEAIKQERAKNQSGTILVDGGDFSMGTLFHVLSPSEAPELRIMGNLGYDVTTFGNHEFDFDTTGTAKMLTAAKTKGGKLPQLVASNIKVKPDSQSGMMTALNEYPVRDYIVINKNNVKIGIFGLISKDGVHDIVLARDIEFKDAQTEAKRVVGILKNNEKVDVIVCLSHGGTNDDPAKSEDELLAKAVPDIDVIISAHTHTTLKQPKKVGHTIIASAGCYGENLGVINLNYVPGQRASLNQYRLVPITAEMGEDQAIVKEINRFKELVNSRFLAFYGFTFNQVIAESSFNMDTIPNLYGQARENGLGDLITDAFRAAAQKAEGSHYEYINVTVQPMGEIRNSFQAGSIEVEDIFRTLSLGMGPDKIPGYPVVAFYLTGSDIKNCLEIQSTLAPIQGNYNMQVSGIKFNYNPYRMPLDRVYGVQISMPDGSYVPMEKDKLYRICTSYYSAALLAKMGPMTHGIVNAAPKDKTGKPLSDLSEAMIDTDNSQAGVQELKQWVALTEYMQGFKDLDGDGTPDLPERYAQPDGRYQSVPSLNPYYLLVDSTKITWTALGGLVLLIVLLSLAIRAIIRHRRKKAGRGGYNV